MVYFIILEQTEANIYYDDAKKFMQFGNSIRD